MLPHRLGTSRYDLSSCRATPTRECSAMLYQIISAGTRCKQLSMDAGPRCLCQVPATRVRISEQFDLPKVLYLPTLPKV